MEGPLPPMAQRSAYAMMPMPEALEAAARACGSPALERALPLPVPAALHCVLARPVAAPHSVPASRCSRLDGYAFAHCSARLPGLFRLHARAHRAGHAPAPFPATGSSGAAEAAWVTTGAPLPSWADTVLGVEDSRAAGSEGGEGAAVELLRSVACGHGVRQPGSDVRAGAELLPAGHAVTPADIASLLLARVPTVHVHAPVQLGVLSTGDEVLAAPCQGGEGAGGSAEAVWDANAPMLRAIVAASGVPATVHSLGHCADAADEALARLLAGAWACTLVVSTGGVSMGDRDFIKPALERAQRGAVVCEFIGEQLVGLLEHGQRLPLPAALAAAAAAATGGAQQPTPCAVDCQIYFGRLNMKPGKPTTLARLTLRPLSGATAVPLPAAHPSPRSALVLALPGNPVSAWVGAHLLLVPCIKALAGLAPWERCMPPCIPVTLQCTLPLDAERPEFHRAVVWLGEGGSEGEAGALQAESTGDQASSRAASASFSNALLCLPQGGQGQGQVVMSGQRVHAYLLATPYTARTRPLVLRQEGREGGGGCGCSSGGSSSTSLAAAALPAPRAPHSFAHPAASARLCVLTVSDSASSPTSPSVDLSGPMVVKALSEHCPSLAFAATVHACVPDERQVISAQLLEWCDAGPATALIITTGGTGFSPRDVTPEATAALLDKRAPGLVAAMLQASLKATPMAALSRYEAGIRGRTLIINLPGSPKAVGECIAALAAVLPHALRLLSE